MTTYTAVLCDMCNYYNPFTDIVVDHGIFTCSSCGKLWHIDDCDVILISE